MGKAFDSIRQGLQEAIAHAQGEANWQSGEGYPDHGDRTDRWAWEFLRRNPEYRKDWDRFIATADVLRATWGKPYSGAPSEREGQEKNPYWVVETAFCDGDERAEVHEPERLPNETESDWVARCGRVQNSPLHVFLGRKWGLEHIENPASAFPSRWHNNSSILFPGEHRNNKEHQWVDFLTHIASLLRSQKNGAAACVGEVLELLEKVPDAWAARITEMRHEEPESRGKCVIEFDLRGSVQEQIKHAQAALLFEQEKWKKNGGSVLSDGRRNKETPGYATYIRVLDALEAAGEAAPSDVERSIATAMIPAYDDSAKHDERKSHLAKVKVWINRAKSFRDGDYMRLVAMSVRPTLADLLRNEK